MKPSELSGPPFYLVLLLRHRPCGNRSWVRLITDPFGYTASAEQVAAGSAWSPRGLANPCECGAEPPEPLELLPEIREALALGPLPETDFSEPVRAPKQVKWPRQKSR